MNSISPSQFFLIDGFGAAISAILLGLVLPRYHLYVGMPLEALYFLAAWPILFAAYDFICYWSVSKNWRPFLRTISIANIAYCLLSVSLLVLHADQLTALGWIYFAGELVIVATLAYLEWRKAGRIRVEGWSG